MNTYFKTHQYESKLENITTGGVRHVCKMCNIIIEILGNHVSQTGNAQYGTSIHQATVSGILV